MNIRQDEQFAPDFVAISPNNRIPAIIDHDPVGGGDPISLFESGAILLYLAEKAGKLIPLEPHGRAEVLQWLFWQMGGLGPMLGQNAHFRIAAPDKLPYAIDRYATETKRLFGVMDRRLADRAFLAGDDYSIADIASYPWVLPHAWIDQPLDVFPNLQRWLEAIKARPAVQRAYALADRMDADVSAAAEPAGRSEK